MSKRDLVNELHREARRNFIRRRTRMIGIDDTVQADLVEMIPYASKNKNMKYILTVINIFSKKAYARALKNKSALEVTRAMEYILDSMDYHVHNLHVDKGKEFYNSTMRRMLDERKIKLYSTYSVMKAAIVERFNRTLKNKMWKEFSFRGSYKWIDILQKLISQYNNTKHRVIRMKPNDVNEYNEKYLLKTVYSPILPARVAIKPKLKLGDSVRISKYKHVFEKGYTPNWTAEVFRVHKIQPTNPPTYLLIDLDGNDINGTFYVEELQKSENPDMYLVEKVIRREGKQLYVKWLGFDDTHNSWINKNDFI